MNALEKALHERALANAKRYQIAEADLLEVLERLDEKKVFRALGYPSLFQYALKELNLSEATAYNFISVARKSREIPEIKTEVKAGNVSVSKLKKVVAIMKKENAQDWLEKAKTLPRAQLEKEVAKVSPQSVTRERSTYVTEKRLSLQVGVDEDLYEKLLRVKDLLSQKWKRAATLEDALEAMADLYIEKLDPVAKAERVTSKAPPSDSSMQQFPGTVQFKRSALPAAIRHHVLLRDQGQCTHLNGRRERCTQTRWLELHHIRPVSQGGANKVDNLQLLCFHHHKAMHGKPELPTF